MHIGIITSEFPPDIGGVEIYAAEFAQALAQLGHQVTVFVHEKHNADFSIPGIEIRPVLRFCRRLDRVILKQQSVDAWQVMNAAHSWLTTEVDEPVAVSIHGNDFLNPYPLTGSPGLTYVKSLWRWEKYLRKIDQWLGRKFTASLMHQSLPKARIILSNSRYTETVFLARFPECQGKTVVAQVGVSPQFLTSKLGSDKNTIPHFLTVSRLSEPRKNVDRVLNALNRLKNQFDFRYTVIGDGSSKAQLETLAQTLDLEDRVEFLGRQPTDLVMEIMGQADLFILTASTLPNSHEGFGIVYIEAAACGTPSLATRQAGAVEAIEDGVSGFFVEEPTVESIQNALESFLTNRQHFDPLACRAFAEKFTWNRVVEKALPFYHT